jgi:hypothetical protein
MENKTIALEKLIPGALSIELRNHQFGTTQRYKWMHDVEAIYVPIDLAVSIFTESGTKKLYDKGYFRIRKDQEEEVLQKAVASGFYHGKVDAKPAAKPVRLEADAIEKLLLANNRSKIEELIARNDRVELEVLVQAALTLQKDLSQGIVDLIEDKLQVPIRIENDFEPEEFEV